MKIKAYHCDSVESAVRLARLELGEEAMLLESKPAAGEARRLGRYEVLFAVAGEAEGKPLPEDAGREPERERLSELSRGIDQIRRMLYSYTHTCYLPTGQFLSQPLLAQIYQELTENDVNAELAAQLAARLTKAAEGGASRKELERDLAEEIQALVKVSDGIGRPGSHPGLAALVGPTGVGKTSTIAKLAVQCGLAQGRRVHLLSIDNYRVAAFDQLRTYAEILGAEWTPVEDTKSLAQALGELQGAASGKPDLVLIDTPGHGFHQLEKSSELAEFLSSRRDIDTHLVLSASTKPKDLRRLVDRYAVFGPAKLLFTKLDETLSFGPLLNEALRTEWPLSFLGVGQRIPEDLAAARKPAVAGLILKREMKISVD